MDAEARAQLAVAWWEYQRLSRGTRLQRVDLDRRERPDVSSAHETLAEVLEAGGDDALEMIAELIEVEPVDDRGATVGAGPLEELVHAHGRALADRIEQWARQRPTFREALSHVWLEEGSFDATTYARLSVVMGEGPAHG
jgi:hypothetical protein